MTNLCILCPRREHQAWNHKQLYWGVLVASVCCQEEIAIQQPSGGEFLYCNQCGQTTMIRVGLTVVQYGQRVIEEEDGSPAVYFHWLCDCGHQTTTYAHLHDESEGIK